MKFTENQLVHIAVTVMNMINKHVDYLGGDIFENNSVLFSPSNRNHYYSIRLYKKGMTANVKEFINHRLEQEVNLRITGVHFEEIYIVNSFWVWNLDSSTTRYKVLHHFVELTSLTRKIMAK